MYHPWRRLRELTDVTLCWHQYGVAGWCRHSTATVSLRTDLTQAERRSTVCHEVVHLERGPGLLGFEDREESAVEREAAKRLIGIRELGEALAWAGSFAEAADELWVDVGTLRARLSYLHPAERAYLARRLRGEGEETA